MLTYIYIYLCYIFSGGIIFWADTIGAKHIYMSLSKWSALYGNFFRPSNFLEDRAMKGIPLVRNSILISFMKKTLDYICVTSLFTLYLIPLQGAPVEA